jgi:hypothetical protein
MIYKPLHRELNIEQHEPLKIPGDFFPNPIRDRPFNLKGGGGGGGGVMVFWFVQNFFFGQHES